MGIYRSSVVCLLVVSRAQHSLRLQQLPSSRDRPRGLCKSKQALKMSPVFEPVTHLSLCWLRSIALWYAGDSSSSWNDEVEARGWVAGGCNCPKWQNDNATHSTWRLSISSCTQHIPRLTTRPRFPAHDAVHLNRSARRGRPAGRSGCRISVYAYRVWLGIGQFEEEQEE